VNVAVQLSLPSDFTVDGWQVMVFITAPSTAAPPARDCWIVVTMQEFVVHGGELPPPDRFAGHEVPMTIATATATMMRPKVHLLITPPLSRRILLLHGSQR
jgi:hypothetical protein